MPSKNLEKPKPKSEKETAANDKFEYKANFAIDLFSNKSISIDDFALIIAQAHKERAKTLKTVKWVIEMKYFKKYLEICESKFMPGYCKKVKFAGNLITLMHENRIRRDTMKDLSRSFKGLKKLTEDLQSEFGTDKNILTPMIFKSYGWKKEAKSLGCSVLTCQKYANALHKCGAMDIVNLGSELGKCYLIGYYRETKVNGSEPQSTKSFHHLNADSIEDIFEKFHKI